MTRQKRYFGEFTDVASVISGFGLKNGSSEMHDLVQETLLDKQILLAVYDVDGYEGRAFVLLRKGRKLYEVNSSHCSCNGLEWSLEPTTWAALAKRDRWNLHGEEAAAFQKLLSRHHN